MNFFGALFFTVFFFSLFIFNENYQNDIDKKLNTRRVVSSIEQVSTFDTLNFRRSYIVLDDKQKINGLSYSKGNVQDYMRRVFGTLIQKSHTIAIDKVPYTDGNTPEYSYNTFLFLSLLVPMHESNLSHFRRMNPKDYCYFSNDVLDPIYPEDFPLTDRPKKIKTTINELNKILDNKFLETKAEVIKTDYCKSRDYNKLLNKKLSLKNMAHFKALCGDLSKYLTQISNTQYLYDGIKALDSATGYKNSFKHCSHYSGRDTVNQLFFSNDYADVGMMMFNAPSHPDVFEKGLIYDLDFVMDFGLDYLVKGFQIISNYNLDYGTEKFIKRKGFSCFEGMDITKATSRITMMKGAWSGKYNSGGLENSCRFKDTNLENKYKLNDENFDRNLARVLYKFKNDSKLANFFNEVVWRDNEKLTPSLLHEHLPKESLEYKAYEELINNVVNGVNNTKYLALVLDTDYTEIQIATAQKKFEETHEEELVIDLVEDNFESDFDEATGIGMDLQVSDVFKIESSPIKDKMPRPVDSSKSEMVEEKVEVTENERIEAERIDLPMVPEVSLNNTVENMKSMFIENAYYSEKLAQEEERIHQLEQKKIKEELEIGKKILKTEPTKIIPLIKKDSIIHYTFGVDINIRTSPAVERKNLCANTRDFGNGTFLLQSYGVNNSFHEVKFSDKIQKELTQTCPGSKYFYIHKSVVRKKINKQLGQKSKHVNESLINTNVYMISDRKLRNRWGMSKSIEVGRISASEDRPVLILITDEYTIRYKGENYKWYEFINKNGKKVWFSDKAGNENTAIRSHDD